MDLIDRYIHYVRDIRRYSPRTVAIYEEVLIAFTKYILMDVQDPVDEDLLLSLNPSQIRQWEVYLLDDKGNKSRTVNQHLSVLSGFCGYLMKEGLLKSNPLRLVHRPKVEKRLPEFYRQDDLSAYFDQTEDEVSIKSLETFMQNPLSKYGKDAYEKRLARLIISMLYGLGLRRSELIGLTISNVDFSRNVVSVIGKGKKCRLIPLEEPLSEEISLYLQAAEALTGCPRTPSEPLLINYSGRELYPMYVDRVVKKELGDAAGFTGRKSPHILRHSVATALLNEGVQLNSIKEMLGHSSLAATQVYTHNSIAKLQKVYKQAHPRAKNKKD